MINGFEDIQKAGKDNVELAMQSFGNVSKSMQAIAAEMADYSKKSFEEGASVLEQMMGAKSFDKALEIQTGYAKSSYEGFMAQAGKMGEMFTDLAKESYKPMETMVAKASK
ncbi:phasin family protein [Tepidamorphus sp. 3E244]|uniref:phasin family protein n=1 Tax=Tepidamorphus sp. 3E244 TaxID=3385498 RepID=UPI0038FBFA84